MVKMKRQFLINFYFLLFLQAAQAQNCSSDKDLAAIPGKYIDVAHFEAPQQKAHWLDQLGTAASKATANKVLTQLETLENTSRKDFTLTGCVLKSAFSAPSNAKFFYGKSMLLSYDLNIGCYEYFCYKNNLKVNDEYANVFRAYVNRYHDMSYAFTFSDDYPFYETYNKYNGKFIALCNFIKQDDIKSINNGKGFYQDKPEASVKAGSKNDFITRHWYITKAGVPLLVPVTRKEYLVALLEYYDREALYTAQQLKDEPARKNYFPDWQQKINLKRAIVQKTLKENNTEWLAKSAVVKSKKENFSWYNNYEPGTPKRVTIDVYYADTPEDAKNTGAFTFSGFWDDKPGSTTLYKYNPAYFTGDDKNPAKPYFIELTYRYTNTPLGKALAENFSNNFDFDAVKNLLK